MSRNCNGCLKSFKGFNVCASKLPSFLNQVLLALQMLQLNHSNKNGAKARDIERFMKEHFNAGGDVENQVITSLIQAAQGGYVIQKSDMKYCIVGPVASVQLSPANSKRRLREIENASKIFVSSPPQGIKETRIKTINREGLKNKCAKQAKKAKKSCSSMAKSTSKLFTRFTDFVKNATVKLPASVTQPKCKKRHERRDGRHHKKKVKRSPSCIDINPRKQIKPFQKKQRAKSCKSVKKSVSKKSVYDRRLRHRPCRLPMELSVPCNRYRKRKLSRCKLSRCTSTTGSEETKSLKRRHSRTKSLSDYSSCNSYIYK